MLMSLATACGALAGFDARVVAFMAVVAGVLGFAAGLTGKGRTDG